MKKSAIAVAVAAAMGASAASAMTVAVDLTRVTTGSANGSSNAVALSGTSYSYDTLSGIVTQVSGTTQANFDINPLPNNELFNHVWSGMTNSGAGGSISAFDCIEGTFGGSVGASLCANTTWGGNFINETTTNYNTVPGTRVVGGDDVIAGPQQQGSDYFGAASSWDGTTLIINSADWVGDPGAAGIQMEFTAAIPVPAAVWLFGSALGLLGWARRRA